MRQGAPAPRLQVAPRRPIPSVPQVREALRAAVDVRLSDSEIASEIESSLQSWSDEGGEGPSRGAGALTALQLRRLLTSGRFRRVESGRLFVLLSLAEAETIRCILHMRQGKPLLPGCPDMALALRCVPAHDMVFDVSAGYVPPPSYMAAASHTCYRFLDSARRRHHTQCTATPCTFHYSSRCTADLALGVWLQAMHFKAAELNALLRCIPSPPAARRLFFASVVGCRRRLAKRCEQTPLATLSPS